MPMRRPYACITAKIFIIVVTFLTLSACARQEVGNRALEYNNALSDFGNKQILLNAVRSAKRLPQYYAAVGDLTGDETLTGSVSGSFPFGRDTTSPFSLSPSLTASSGITSFQVGNLNKGDFAANLLKEVRPDLFLYYQDNGWRLELLINIMISHITLPERDNGGLDFYVRNYCKKPYPEDRALCRSIWTAPADLVGDPNCQASPYPKLDDARKRLVVKYSNHGRDACLLAQFQSFVRKLLILGPRLIKQESASGRGTIEETVEAKVPTKSISTVTTKYKRKTVPPEKKATYRIDFFGRSTRISTASKRLRAIQRRLKRGLDLSSGTTSFVFELRSPQAMIYYLGELIGLHVFKDSAYRAAIVNKDYDPQHQQPDEALISLFVVEKSAPGSGAVSVFHRDAWYSIPEPDHSSETAHRSLQVLALISQVISLQTEAEDVPKQSNVNLIAN